MRPTIRAADSRTVHGWDGFVLFWVALWVVIGGWTGLTLWQASDTGDTITNSGEALDTTGEALRALSGIPVIGERTGQLGDEVVATGADISDRGQEIKGELRRLAILQSAAIVGIPLAPVAGLYLPLRLAWRREVADVKHSLRAADEQEVEALLAERAATTCSYAEVVRARASSDEAGTRRRLADLELRRLGLTRPTTEAGTGSA